MLSWHRAVPPRVQMWVRFALSSAIAGGAAAACSAPATGITDPFHLKLAASLAVGVDQVPAVLLTLSITNAGTAPVEISYTGCPLGNPIRLRVYPSTQAGSGTTPTLWDSMLAYKDTPCSLVGAKVGIAPGTTTTLSRTIPISDILGDSLKAGQYDLLVSAAFSQPTISQDLLRNFLTLSP